MKRLLVGALLCAGAARAEEPLRRLSVDASLGGWAQSRSDGAGRAWELAVAVRAGWAVTRNLEVDLSALRAGSASGTPFASASVTRDLALVRAFLVLGDRFAVLVGAGGGAALARTRTTVLPGTGGASATTQGTTAARPVMEVTAAARARVFGGLEGRAEVSALARDGRLEVLPLVGLGAAF